MNTYANTSPTGGVNFQYRVFLVDSLVVLSSQRQPDDFLVGPDNDMSVGESRMCPMYGSVATATTGAAPRARRRLDHVRTINLNVARRAELRTDRLDGTSSNT